LSAGADAPVCLLTGAGGRLGEAVLRALGDRMRFVAVYRTRVPTVANGHAAPVDPLRPDVAQAAARSGGAVASAERDGIYAVQADLREPGAVRRVVEVALARFERIDHVVNAAADAAFHGSTLEAAHVADELAGQLLLNCLTPALLASEVASAYWRERPEENRALRRCVVNVSSVSGINVYAGTGQGGYSASKAGLQFLSCHMAADFARIGVRVNALAPDRFPSAVPVESVAAAVGTLFENDATGKVFFVDRAGLRSLN
jgi:NAD(P)-dependent dehydrogenase (short-subunit alcohol dehydrogenase family)